MEKVVVFLDYANLAASTRALNCEIDHAALLNYLADQAEGRYLQAAFAYVPVDPRREHAMDETVAQLWEAGYIVKTKTGTIAGQSYKCDFDVEIAMDTTKAAYDMHPDIMVLISGDSDFIPLVLDLRRRGIRTEVAAFSQSMSGQLSQRCSGFINLDALLPVAEPEYEDAVEDLPESAAPKAERAGVPSPFSGASAPEARFVAQSPDESGSASKASAVVGGAGAVAPDVCPMSATCPDGPCLAEEAGTSRSDATDLEEAWMIAEREAAANR